MPSLREKQKCELLPQPGGFEGTARGVGARRSYDQNSSQT
jgi:hypothetical protein